MNTATTSLVVDTIGAVQHLLTAGLDGAVVAHEGDDRFWLVQVDYWENSDIALSFEATAAEEARQRGSQRAVIALPLICREVDGTPAYRPWADEPLEDGETERVFALSVDLADGMDVHHCVFTRNATGTLEFGSVMTHEVQFQLAGSTPGSVLVGDLVKLD